MEINELKIGDRVKYIRIDSEFDKTTGYYPPLGTLGTIDKLDYADTEAGVRVKWDKGTKGGAWWCNVSDIITV